MSAKEGAAAAAAAAKAAARAVNSVASSEKSPPDFTMASIISQAAAAAAAAAPQGQPIPAPAALPATQQAPVEATLLEKTETSSFEKSVEAALSPPKKADAELVVEKTAKLSLDTKQSEAMSSSKKMGNASSGVEAETSNPEMKPNKSPEKKSESSSTKKTDTTIKKETEESSAEKKSGFSTPEKVEQASPVKKTGASALVLDPETTKEANDDGLWDEACGGEPLFSCDEAGFCEDDYDEEYPYPDDCNLSTATEEIENYSCMERREAEDFIFGKLIGEGSFSTVYLAKDIHTQKQYAIKVCRKVHILREKKVESIKREKDILSLLSAKVNPDAPYFVKLYCTFQDKAKLYFVLSFAKYGDLLNHIVKVGSFDIACTKFYAAEILVALEHMHSLGIVHRDLKPENILLDENMHVKITDFGSSKIYDLDENGLPYSNQRRNSFVGTAQYISPDLLLDTVEFTRSTDLWAYGAIIYQMVSGLPPFRSNSEYLIFKQIKNVDYHFPDGFCPCAKDLVQKFLVVDPSKRLGAQDGTTYVSIRAHPFFSDIVFENLHKQEPPPIYPYLPGTSEHEEFRSNYRVPDDLEPGLDDRQITRLLGLELSGGSSPPRPSPPGPPAEKGRKKSGLGLKALSPQDIEVRLSVQRLTAGRWHNLCDGNLIVKQGLVDKRKGLFARRRMLMLTLGPHLYYADPVSMVLKGEIPWSEELRVEPKNFKIFFVHTPNRTYYLEDPEGYALEWCKAIEEVRVHTYGDQEAPKRDQNHRT